MPFPTKDGTMHWFTGRGSCLLLAALLLLMGAKAPGLAMAQDVSTRDWNRAGDTLEGAMGLHYGKLGGTGLSFRLPLRWYLYTQFAGGIWHGTDDQRHNLGLQINYLLRQDAQVRLYLGGGVGYFYHREKVGTSAGVDLWHRTHDWNTGAGVGLEYLLGPRVGLQGELDFVHEGRDGEIKVSPQVGIHYYW